MFKRLNSRSVTYAIALLGAAILFWYTSLPRSEEIQKTWYPPVDAGLGNEPITPIPLVLDLDKDKVALGHRLFFDTTLSANGKMSCASCHKLEKGGVDGQAYSTGVAGGAGEVNSLTVYNSGFNFRLFWDGRAASLEEVVTAHVENAKEMGAAWPDVISRLQSDAAYRKAFSAYPSGIDRATVSNAIATYVRSLTTPNAKFDHFLRGEKNALDGEEFAGYALFKRIGCITCHQGVNVGGNMYAKLGLVENYFDVSGNVRKVDLGRYNLTGLEKSRYEFRVPSLRNVALTAPYFHDASAQNLDTAVAVMARYQLGVELSAEEIAHIVKFLNTLTGELDASGDKPK